MLKLTIPSGEIYDEEANRFYSSKGITIQLEHSLVSISKWESHWHKPFIGDDKRSYEETIDYIKCMTLTQNVDPDAYMFLSEENVNDVNRYINDPMTATWFGEDSDKEPSTAPPHQQRAITSELIYYWLFKLEIPIECQKWHLNRLITLIRVFNAEDKAAKTKNKSFTQSDLAKRRALNEQRRRRLHTRG